MNRFFDFTKPQLKFLALLSVSALLMAGYLFVRSYAVAADNAPGFEIFIGENEQQFTGLFLLDPNTAPADSLELLPGVGRILADRIVEYRQTHRFRTEVDITEVHGIGPKLFERIRPYLKVNRY